MVVKVVCLCADERHVKAATRVMVLAIGFDILFMMDMKADDSRLAADLIAKKPG